MKSQSTLGTLISILFATSVYGEEMPLLSPEKQSYYEYQQQQIDSGYQKLRYDWLSPINLKASTVYEKSASTGSSDTRQNLSAGIAQDLFRCGGITYAINYANAKKETDTIALERDVAGVNHQIINAVLNYRKNALMLEQSELKLKNTKIEIFLKRKQYEAGDIDITLLNNALMNQSSELKNNTSVRYTLAQQKFEAVKLSDTPIDTVSLPTFTLTPKETFLEEGWNIRYTRSLSQSSAQQYGQIKSSYLPKLTLIADAGLQRLDSREFSSADNSGSFYDMGLQLSMPLSYNASATVQEAQSLYLKQQAESADTKRQMDGRYDQSIAQIESYQNIIIITKENLNYYDELIGATKAAVNTGYKAGYDLQTLQNTRSIEELEIHINEINIQIELSTLHYLMRHPQEKSL
ncbi:MAG: TolC family protein [Sulfuricurvum sp.]|nr:TolC family protein [Sulfuricurvum sp.]